jgi:hypothetical protein
MLSNELIGDTVERFGCFLVSDVPTYNAIQDMEVAAHSLGKSSLPYSTVRVLFTCRQTQPMREKGT